LLKIKSNRNVYIPLFSAARNISLSDNCISITTGSGTSLEPVSSNIVGFEIIEFDERLFAHNTEFIKPNCESYIEKKCNQFEEKYVIR
jgi:hypothetical protein